VATAADSRRTRPIVERIARFNAGRDPERLALKYKAMADDAFAFFRGTCHVFHEDWPKGGAFNQAPFVWACGDLHAENFGAYLSSDRIDRFDLTDFDEAALAPCTVDLARFATSLLIGARVAKVERARRRDLVATMLDAYLSALREGKALWIEHATATGMVRALLGDLDGNTRRKLLKKRTRKGGRRLKVDGRNALPASPAERRMVRHAVERFRPRFADPPFGPVLDVARRVAGLGSLGLERYVVLVAGSAVSKPSLLDLKAAPRSTLAMHSLVHQPAWRTQAERVVTLQSRAQAVPPALLHEVKIGSEAFVLRELQPREDRLDLDPLPPWRRLVDVVETMAKVVAWAHLRGAGRQGSANIDDLVAFAEETRWRRLLIEYVLHYGRQVERDWETFVAAREAATFVPGR
jgi:uncharacterized protein (DUF2252 family)